VAFGDFATARETTGPCGSSSVAFGDFATARETTGPCGSSSVAFGDFATARETTGPCGSSSVGRASASQAEGRGFEPRLPLAGLRLPLRADACGCAKDGVSRIGVRGGAKMPLGVTGNTSDSGSEESWFEPRRGNSRPVCRPGRGETGEVAKWLRQRFAKPSGPKGSRGFESHPLRSVAHGHWTGVREA
jgi:hypothetical protein